MAFRDRIDAGRQLAEQLRHLAGEDLVVLGLPRGGVPVAHEVAAALHAPLDVIVVRKLGVPYQPELAMGAIGEDGARTLNDEVIRLAGITDDELARVEAMERVELERRSERFRAVRPRVDLTGRTAVIVDDGVATGSTARAACQVARAHGAARVVLAAPVAPVETANRFAADADEVVIVSTPQPFYAVGEFYRDFSQTTDEEVLSLLAAADPPLRSEEVVIDVDGVSLAGHLEIPEQPIGVVVFVHGSGSSRHSPRNRAVAALLNDARIGTLLFDLLTPAEELDRANVFDVELLATRLAGVTAWLRAQPEAAGLAVGYFGASTGAAAALWAAAEPGATVAAVVSRGGRPDLAAPHLPAVDAPTLLIVGSLDQVVLDLNREAAALLRCEHELVVIPGATHLFEEPGTLQAAAEAARDFFSAHLAR